MEENIQPFEWHPLAANGSPSLWKLTAEGFSTSKGLCNGKENSLALSIQADINVSLVNSFLIFTTFAPD